MWYLTGYQKTWIPYCEENAFPHIEQMLLIEEIIKRLQPVKQHGVGVIEGEDYSMASVFPDSMKLLKKLMSTDTADVTSSDGFDGVRTMLNVVYQMCLLAYCRKQGNPVTKLWERWQQASIELGAKEEGKKFGVVLYYIVFLSIAAQDDQVSQWKTQSLNTHNRLNESLT